MTLLKIVQRIVVQPIVVANDDGSNRANFLGTPAQEADILARVNQIFAQAGVEVDFLQENQFNSTFANVGNSFFRPQSDFFQIISSGDAAGVGSSDPNVVDLYFIDRVPGGALGVGFLGQSGAVVGLADEGFTTASSGLSPSREGFARIIAHEIGHNLGLGHSDLPGLLFPRLTGGNRFLNDAQVDSILGSSITQELGAVQATSLSSIENAQTDPASATGGCGGCGLCAACKGVILN